MDRHGDRVSDVVDSSAPPAMAAFDQVVLQASPELRRWLDNAKPLNVHDDVMIIAVPSNFARNLLEVRFRPQVEDTLTSFYGRQMKIVVTVDDGLNPSPSAIELDQEASRERRPADPRGPLDAGQPAQPARSNHLTNVAPHQSFPTDALPGVGPSAPENGAIRPDR